MNRKRVVVTGLGAVTPLGNTRDEFWRGLIAGQERRRPVTSLRPASDLDTKIAAEVKDFDADALIGRREARRMDRYTQFAFVAAREAIADAKFPTDDRESLDVTGVIVGTGIGGISRSGSSHEGARDRHRRAHQPVLHSDADGERRAGAISMAYQLPRADVCGVERLRERERRDRNRVRVRRAAARAERW